MYRFVFMYYEEQHCSCCVCWISFLRYLYTDAAQVKPVEVGSGPLHCCHIFGYWVTTLLDSGVLAFLWPVLTCGWL